MKFSGEAPKCDFWGKILVAWTAEVESRAPNLKRLAPHRAGRAGGKGPDDESAMLAKKVSLKSKSKESEFKKSKSKSKESEFKKVKVKAKKVS